MHPTTTRPGAQTLIRCALIAAAAILWIAGCDAASKRTSPQNQSLDVDGATTMNQAQSAVQRAKIIPPVDAAEPARLETATFATG